MTTTTIELTRIKNDLNGNPRYICHFSNISPIISEALRKAKTIGGKKYDTKNNPGCIVFQSYNIYQTRQDILNLNK